MNISIKQLKAFLCVAQTGSFTQAAHQLHLTQSGLSGLIKELESQLNLRLFDRTTRQIFLSDAGRQLLPLAQRTLNELNHMALHAESLRDGAIGKVRFAVSQQLAASAMPKIIANFQREFTHLELHMLDCSVEQVLQQVQTADVDFGIGPERDLPDDIESKLLFKLPFYIVLPPTHPLCQKSSVDWQDLHKETLITLNGPFTERLIDEMPEILAKNLRLPTYSVNFLSTAMGMVEAGLGLTLCLPFAAIWVRQHGLQMRPLEPAAKRGFCLYYRKKRSLPAAAQTFYQYLQQHSPQIWQADAF
ncbi:MAG: LysR family transcriptional regulator [Neisseria sp.]|nr:LysR family transcriptional regulator [Neisseria sp.]